MKTRISLIFIYLLSIQALLAQIPIFEWAKSMGGDGPAIGRSIAVDATGNIYTIGTFVGPADFDPNNGITLLSSEGVDDIFIQKLDPSGNLLWVKQMGGISEEYAPSIVVDDFGNVYSTGTFERDVDFDPGVGTAILTSEINAPNVYIQKLDTNGNFLWVKQMGSSGRDEGISIDLDDFGNIYTSGTFQGTVDFDPGLGSFLLTSNGLKDIFIQKLDSDGNFVYAKKMGGFSGDLVRNMKVDNDGNIYITGHFEGTSDFDPGTGTVSLTSVGDSDVFILKLDSAGEFLWVKQMGGTGFDLGSSIATDDLGNVYTVGQFRGTVDFDPSSGSDMLTSEGLGDTFIQKLDPNGNFLWVKRIGGDRPDVGLSIDVDNSGQIYITGYFEDSVDFDPGTGVNMLTTSQSNSMYILKLNSSGDFSWVVQTSGTNSYAGGHSITVDPTGNIYTTGAFAGVTDFDPGIGTYNLSTSTSGSNVFIQKLSVSTLGINDLEQDVNVFVYPNPSEYIFNIKFGKTLKNAELIIHNIRGELISTKSITDTSKASFILKESPGIYFLTIRTTEGQKTIKLVKK